MDFELIEKEFEQDKIKTRKGKSGAMLSYVETPEYIRRLNQVFDYNWSFEIVDDRIEGDFVIVKGKLTAEGITKMQYGTSQVTKSKDDGELIAIGDDFKAAASDCLKKCASLFGIGLHLYNSAPEVSGMDKMTANKGRDRVTKAQLNKIKALRMKLGMSSGDVLDLIERMFNTRDVMNLNKEMASAVISVLDKKLSEESDEEVI
ncbi:MAG: Rad52/Rad22 family DNA repair protein [Candidatus Syntropharchaeales archaeon]